MSKEIDGEVPKEIIGAPIAVDQANEYITNHIQHFVDAGRYPVKSMIFDAGLLRDYLNQNMNIQNVKFMLAMRPDDVGINQCSMIIVGYDQDGNYIKTQDGMVLDHAGACPYTCPSVGPAQGDHIS